MLKHILVIFLLLMSISLTQAQGSPDIPPASFNVEAVDVGVLCAEEVAEFSIGVTIPGMNIQPVEALDIMMLMDTTASMSAQINSVKDNVEQIADRLRLDVPDINFGLAAFADYPEFGGGSSDEPFNLLSGFSNDIAVFRSGLSPVDADGGGDTQESLLRGLWEVAQLDWRPDAIHAVIVFTDASARDPDPGADRTFDTPDDIRQSDAIAALNAKKIQVLSVQSRNGRAARNTLQTLADETDGAYFQLINADEIPDLIVTGVSGLIARSQFSFKPGATDRVSLSSAEDDWFRQSPSNFRYDADGVNRNIEFSIYPAAINQSDGTYDFDFDLTRRNESFGVVPVHFEYYEKCSDFYIPDTTEDEGTSCTPDVFWESPSILLSYTEDSTGAAAYPRIGQENFVFVDVFVRGPRPATGSVSVYVSDSALVTSFPTGWETIGMLSQEMQPNTQARFGPFSWIPTTETASIRAIVRNASDPANDLANVSCENNVASLHRARVALDNYTLGQGSNRIGGYFHTSYAGVSPTFQFQTANLDGFLRINGESVASNQWQTDSNSGTLELLLASTPATNASLPVMIEDQVAGGMTIYYTTQQSSLSDSDNILNDDTAYWDAHHSGDHLHIVRFIGFIDCGFAGG